MDEQGAYMIQWVFRAVSAWQRVGSHAGVVPESVAAILGTNAWFVEEWEEQEPRGTWEGS